MGFLDQSLIIAGTHGVEPQSVYFAEKLAESLDLVDLSNDEIASLTLAMTNKETSPMSSREAQLQSDLIKKMKIRKAQNTSLYMITCLNPNGLEAKTRGNANLVDLNRNMPSQNWKFSELENNPYYPGNAPASEEETKVLLELLKISKPKTILSFHTNHFVANANEPQINYDAVFDPANPSSKEDLEIYNWGLELASRCKLPLTRDIGYDTPGSLGSYAKDHGIHCFTVEFEDELTSAKLWNKYSKFFV